MGMEVTLSTKIKAPLVTGVKTVTTVAAPIFAGASALKGRKQMIVYNESPNTVYYGASDVAVSTGMPLLSGDSVMFDFNSGIHVDIYFIASTDSMVRVVELK